VTPPSRPGTADAARPPLWLLVIPFGIVLAVAALTPTASLFPHQGDVSLYLEKAIAIADGGIPYRDVSLEYPPLAFVPMVVPYLLWPFGPVDLDVYKWLFAAWEAVMMVALGLVLAQVVRRGGLIAVADDRGWPAVADAPPLRVRTSSVAIRMVILSAGAALALTWRFDLFPALLVMLALWAALEGRPVIAGVAIAAGVLAKLYPLALVPALAIPWLVPFDSRRLIRYGTAIAVTLAVGLLPFLALAGSSALTFLGYQALRGLQIESVGGGLVVLDGLLRGQPVDLSSPFLAVEVRAPQASLLLAALPVLTLLGYGLLAWLGWRRLHAERDRLGRVSPATVVLLAAASVVVLLATSKVFSIQYVVWFVPFAALLPKWQFWLAAVIVGLTMPIHPLLYDGLVAQDALPIVILNLRNGLLVVLAGWLIWDLRPGALEGGGPGAMRGLPA
jgi:hypothetical protein